MPVRRLKPSPGNALRPDTGRTYDVLGEYAQAGLAFCVSFLPLRMVACETNESQK